jgi:hypothetical protein
MEKVVLLLCLFIFFYGYSFAQLKKGQIDPAKSPTRHHHYLPEYTFDVSSNPTQWEKLKPGLNVSFASTDELYLRSEIPQLQKETQVWEATGWKGERLNGQILVWSPDTVEQIRITLNDLKDATGNILSKENIHLSLVSYVLSNYPYNATNVSCDVPMSDSAYLMPDRLEPLSRFDHPGKTVRPVWVSIDLPVNTKPGVYAGALDVNSDTQHVSLQLKIKVQNQTLPAPQDWKFRLDLWQNPWVVASYYNLQPWSEEHKSLLKKHLRLYAEAGGKYITTYAVHSPWSDNSYSLEGTMIDWIKRKDGSWKFDYNIFDQYVQLAIDAGIDKAITIYTPVPWGHRFRYLDENSGNYVYEEWSPESEKFRTFWKIFLDDLKAHLEKKGWFEKTYLGINENPLQYTLAAARVIKAHSKAWKITYAGDWHPELSALLDDYSPVISSEPNAKELADRKAKGFTTTYYVCCTPPKPNNFVFSPPAEGRFISWYAAAYGYDGFLRWAYDAWPADPVRDARHTLWPAGDCFLVYPGGNSSIRFEKLREGIVDFEKIAILRELASKSTDKKVMHAMKELENHLRLFIDNPDFSKRDFSTERITVLVNKGGKMIESLSDALTR